MSRLTFTKRAGVLMAVVAFVLGITAASAPGWGSGGEETTPTKPKHEGKEKNKGKEEEGEEHGEKQKPKPEQPKVQTPPVAQPAPPAAAPPAPVVSQGAPAPPVTGESLPPEQEAVPEAPVVAQAPPEQPALAPVAERKELAQTGLDPGLIALLGALCLAGGGLLFRRALARG
jgi:LPXTG-motif cell wall-anchored protein